MNWKEYLENTPYDNDDMSYLDDAIKMFQKNNPSFGWVATDHSKELYIPEEEEEPEDENLKLAEFYGTLLYEKMTRFPKIGKMVIADFYSEQLCKTNIYKVTIEISHNFENMSAKEISESIMELEQLEDSNNNVSISINNEIIVEIKINIEDLKTLKSAAEASSKFNL